LSRKKWIHVALLSPVHTGDKAEFNMVDLVERRQSRPCRFGPVGYTLAIKWTVSTVCCIENCENLDVDLEATACLHSLQYSTVSATKLTISATVDFVADLLPVSATTDFQQSRQC